MDAPTMDYPDPGATSTGLPILRLAFTSDARGVSLRMDPPPDAPALTCRSGVFDALPPLPGELDRYGVARLADAYKAVLRSFSQPDATGLNNAYEQILTACSGRQPFELRISGNAADGTLNPALLPWELILYGDGISVIERAAIVRSLGRTEGYAPTQLSDPFRTLMIQGGQLAGEPPLEFEAERISLGKAWRALGPARQARVAAPAIETIAIADLVARLRHVRPHLLWFSGHGQVGVHGVELLFAGADGWVPVARIADAVRKACTVPFAMPPPFVAAFWACESLGHPSAPLVSAGDAAFPDLVNALAGVGVEAVIGCQTRIWDWSARVLAEGLFRALAEGLGPARAVAAARAALVRAPDPLSEGSDVEWASPVLWTGGARMPVLRWARPPREDEGILLRKLCDESAIAQEGASVIVPDDAPTSAARAWIAQAPTWVEHPQLEKDRLGVLTQLRRAAFEDSRALLVIPVDDGRDFLRAFAETLATLHSRLFPGLELTETEWLMAIFSLARSEARRAEAWRRLLDRDDLMIAIIADGGLDYSDVISEAASRRFPLLVFSPAPIQQPTGGAPAAEWAADTWQRDGDITGLIATLDHDRRMLVEALSLLNLPMTKEMLDRFGADFEVARASQQLRDGGLVVAYGARYVLSAAVAYAVDRALVGENRRAAHRACLHFLEREPNSSFLSAEIDQLRWRLAHARALDRDEDVVHLASRLIEGHVNDGRSDLVVRQYQALKRLRRGLTVDRMLDVAHAYNLQGVPERALDVLDFVPRENLRIAQRVLHDLRRAEALRSQNERTKQEEATALLENTLAEARRDMAETGADPDIKRLVLIVRHDLARNDLFFGRRPNLERAEAAKQVFEDVIGQCGDDPARVYLKVAALRNLADVCDPYAYGLPTDPQLAVQHLKEAKRLITGAPAAVAMRAEVSYKLARALNRAGLAKAARMELEDAISAARRDGNALILAIASNYRFWNDHRDRDTLTDPEWSEWRRQETQLDALADRVSWAARVLVTTRLRAARRRATARADEALGALSAARDLLNARDGLRTPSDVKDRWMPAYAGLAVLRARVATHAAYDPDVWAELGRDLDDAGVGSSLDPEAIWRAFH